ncbi:MAG: 30S ribosomal protein S6 [Candidatus Omnitrophota bacterium]|jgi:small subunit ribosomal protein S6
MNSYDGVFIIRPDLKEEDAKNVFKAVNDAIIKHGGTIKKEENWGKKQLAYKIKKVKEAYYYKLDFDVEPANLLKIEGIYKLNADILRTMITVK